MRYLNHAGTSWPKPDAVRRAVQQALAASPEQYPELFREALRVIEGEFDPGRLLLTSGCTAALGLVLGDLPWQSGDRLVTSSIEHHALDRQARLLESSRGVEQIALDYRPGEPVDLQQLRTALQTERVRAVALTAASNITGELLPLQEIAQLVRPHGALLIVDAAQTFGTDLFEPVREHADVIVAAGHKSALGPQGIGVLYAREPVEFACPTAVCEVNEQRCGSFFGYCDAGSVNLAGACGLAAGLAWSRQVGRVNIGQRTRAWAQRLRYSLAEREDVRLLGPVEADTSNAVVSFVPTRWPLEQAEQRLNGRGLLLRVGTHCAPRALQALDAAGGCARLSLGPFNRAEDVELALRSLED